MKKMFFCLLFLLTNYSSFSQRRGKIDDQVVEVYPANWWVNMKNKQLQLMLHLAGIKTAKDVRIYYRVFK
jgi:hypothetical protein